MSDENNGATISYEEEEEDWDIFQKGSLLHYVQDSDVLEDGKEFVDKPALCSPFTVVQHWRDLRNKAIDEMRELTHQGLIKLAKEIHLIWWDLLKHVWPEVKQNPFRTSMIYIPNVFVIPGGRFKEIYYWDTYWVVKALLRSGSYPVARGIIENYFYILKEYGFIPNGNRKYYLDRSQPPLLLSMVKDYTEMTGDQYFLLYIDLMIVEMKWFQKHRMITVEYEGRKYKMFVYGTNGSGPRPESYKEDLEAMHQMKLSSKEQDELYKHIRAGAESGWDFSTRWIIDSHGGCSGGMESVKANLIIPVDLNAIMYKNYATLAKLLADLDRHDESQAFLKKANNLKVAVMQVLFNKQSNTWRDFDIMNHKQRDFYFASNLFPLWADCYPVERRAELGAAAADYLTQVSAVRVGGLVTSNNDSGLQWDAPNCWAPLQEMAVTGLLKTGDEKAAEVAKTIAQNFTINALVGCGEDGLCELYEKYNSEHIGKEGGGGEYKVQTGFGWTNGVLVEFLCIFGDDLMDANSKVELEHDVKHAPGWTKQAWKASMVTATNNV